MTSPDSDMLNEKFSLADELSFKAGPAGGAVAYINNQYAKAEIALDGGHVLTYQLHGQDPVLWLSPVSKYGPGQAIRGGIPVCWPWFSAHPDDGGKPAHGFVRITPWTVSESKHLDNGATQIRFSLSSNPTSLALWPYEFILDLIVTVGTTLAVELVAQNSGDTPFNYTGALHTYFAVSDIEQIQIEGLDRTAYLDKVQDYKREIQSGPVRFTGETDRIYLDTSADSLIVDPGLKRTIRVQKTGSQTTVVWNPWVTRSIAMADMPDDGYKTMVCVETANAADDVIRLEPGDLGRVKAVIGVEA